MLDHVFIDAIGAVRDALESALLERQALEERLHSDLILGDVVWETTYAIPGEGTPPRAQVDVTLTWPTWAQSAYRSWYLNDELEDAPVIDVDLTFRVQRLREQPQPRMLVAVFSSSAPTLGEEPLTPTPPTTETNFNDKLEVAGHAFEVTYTGSYELNEAVLEDGSDLDAAFGAVGAWSASVLVRLGDLPLAFAPPLIP